MKLNRRTRIYSFIIFICLFNNCKEGSSIVEHNEHIQKYYTYFSNDSLKLSMKFYGNCTLQDKNIKLDRNTKQIRNYILKKIKIGRKNLILLFKGRNNIVDSPDFPFSVGAILFLKDSLDNIKYLQLGFKKRLLFNNKYFVKIISIDKLNDLTACAIIPLKSVNLLFFESIKINKVKINSYDSTNINSENIIIQSTNNERNYSYRDSILTLNFLYSDFDFIMSNARWGNVYSKNVDKKN
jgi:hypothetical protein